MTISPLSRSPQYARTASPDPAWSVDLFPSQRPASPAPAPAPRPAAPLPTNTNVAQINGQNVRYAGPGRSWDVDMTYLQADLIDLTPHDPLAIWEFGTYQVRVKAGQVRMTEEQANKMIASQLWQQGPDFPVKKGSVEFRKNNVVKVKGAYNWGFLPIPLSVTAGVATPTDTSVKVSPKSVRVFGLPVLWAIKLFNVDVAKYMPQGGMAAMNPDHTVTLDLNKTDMFKGSLRKIDIQGGKAVVTIGDAPTAPLTGPRTRGVPNYTEVVARGEVALESAIIRNATVVTIDNTPEDPYSFNLWDVEGYAHVESGDVILDEARLAKKFASAGAGFLMKSAKLKGQDLVVEGTYEVFGLPIPLDFKINFSKTADGKLKLTPHDVRIVGISGGRDKLLDAMAGVQGLKRSGDGYILDLREGASVDMPNIRNIKTEAGRIILQP
jgi:hypothetical protein